MKITSATPGMISPVQVIAHRGVRTDANPDNMAPENTMPAFLEAARQVTPVTCAIDALPWLATKERAFRCHRSQLGFFATLLRMPRAIRRPFFGSESYTRAQPPVAPGEARESDFFAT